MGRMYFERKPARRAPSVMKADTTAPRKKKRTSEPKKTISCVAAGASPPRTRVRRSATALPKWVTLPVAWEVTTAQTTKVMTLTYPATHDREIASRDFIRNE